MRLPARTTLARLAATAVAVAVAVAVVLTARRAEPFEPAPVTDAAPHLARTVSQRELARQHAAATAPPLAQPGPAHQRSARQPAWAPSLARAAAASGVQVAATDAVTAAAMQALGNGWEVLASARQPGRVLLVAEVHEHHLQLAAARAPSAGGGGSSPAFPVHSWRARCRRPAAAPVVMCTTAAEEALARALLLDCGAAGAVVRAEPGAQPLSRPGLWAMLLPLDSPALHTLQALHAQALVSLLDYYSADSPALPGLPAPARLVHVDVGSILDAPSGVTAARLACLAFDLCAVAPAGAASAAPRLAAALAALPDAALLDLGLHAAHGIGVSQASLDEAARRFGPATSTP